MNVYDFDKTVFFPDSSAKFYLYCLRHYPLAVIKTMPRSALKGAEYYFERADAAGLKEQLFSFLPSIPDIGKAVNDFWAENRSSIGKWFIEQKRNDDIIISASPEFLLEPICESLNIRLIGTRMNRYTGKISGKNCHDVEKVRRLRELLPDAHIESFYSDSFSDTPLAELAENAYIVKRHVISKWRFQD